MVEEIKQKFKGSKVGDIGNLFVGKILQHEKDKDIYYVEGKDVNDINSKIKTVHLASNKIDEGQVGLSFVEDLQFLNIGDIVSINGERFRNIFRPSSDHNVVFATVRCNSNCLMCSQPPMDYDDTGEYFKIWSYAIELMPKHLSMIGFTGGEPLLMGDRLIMLLNQLTDKYPEIRINVLSNGRLQAKKEIINMLSMVKSPGNIVFAVPLYSDFYQDHDHIVQAKDAFYQTILGIHNLSQLGFLIEIRIVLHKLSLPRLDSLAEFIHLNFPFVFHVTFMGLEIVGYTNAHKEDLLIKDTEYQNIQLMQSVSILEQWKYNVSIYNLPFCYLDESLWEYARQSISDWKNSFHEDCSTCAKKNECAGFFSWNLKYTQPKPIIENSL